ncbi:hypothetical protein [Roseibium sediminicola]|uniref:Transcriptional regulator n=1 Tax=Roseibium sediminicola TaxID=2933272 RepID=A0ABT0GM96_9HYPH|nr:hypothetical protein [Roseibium sp. CAU 1639]MCK7610529.1 hypothetical protein [Roseibium sp. CAU 1639]
MTSMKDEAERMKPRRETAETKAETTRRVAREINQAEADVRDAKTARLKAARLAQEAAATSSVGKPGARAPRKTRAKS